MAEFVAGESLPPNREPSSVCVIEMDDARDPDFALLDDMTHGGKALVRLLAALRDVSHGRP
jgi:hypothetical protein